MDIDARIKRRQRRDEGPRLVQDYTALSPVAHLDEPSDRGPVLERLLDHLDPVFDGRLPPNAYVHGPFGSGKTAIVTALFTHLEQLSVDAQSVIHTSTRAGSSSATPRFVYVDVRETNTEFAFYHRVLDALVEPSVPEHGIGTDEVRRRLHDVVDNAHTGVVVAADHVGPPDDTEGVDVVSLFAGLPSNVSWVAIGRAPPEDVAVTEYTARSIAVEPYRRQMLVDVLMARASVGLAPQALDHALARRISEWAEGNAHDAIAALFVATDHANDAARSRLTEADVDAALDAMPRPSVSLGRVLSLPTNKQLVLRELVDLDAADRETVTATTEAISASPAVDLSAGTVKRYLYELAEDGVVERVQAATSDGKGRPPSRVELRFPAAAFRRLYDGQQ
ncbi:MAG: Cdc6/Cdc18 family protein [Halobacterium sp.]